MKHIHHDMIVEWAKDISRVVQSSHYSEDIWYNEDVPIWHPRKKYRFKPAEPKFIVVNGIQVPEPVRGELEEDQSVWLADTSLAIPCRINWLDATAHTRWLSLGLIHLTREAAQAHIDAMLLPSRTDK
jgi:hypothetical protein